MERKWEELAMDCLVNVFEKLEIQDLALGVPFVCKSWYKASLDPHCWKSINLWELNCGPSSPLAERFNHEYRIHNFSITGLMKLALNRGRASTVELLLPETCTLQSLIYASNKCPCLKILGLPLLLVKDKSVSRLSARDEEKKQFLGLISKWKDLEYLHIRETHFYTNEILFEISQHCKNFVGIKKKGFFDKIEMQNIVSLLPQLKHLIVTSGYMWRQNFVMVVEGCKELETLVVKVCGFKVDEDILKMTSHIKNFEYTDIEDDADDHEHGVSDPWNDLEFSDF